MLRHCKISADTLLCQHKVTAHLPSDLPSGLLEGLHGICPRII
jgi:hypothetical protein